MQSFGCGDRAETDVRRSLPLLLTGPGQDFERAAVDGDEGKVVADEVVHVLGDACPFPRPCEIGDHRSLLTAASLPQLQCTAQPPRHQEEDEVAEHAGEPLREIVSRFAEEPDHQLTDDSESEPHQCRMHRSPSAADEIGGNDEKDLQEGPLTAGDQRDQQDTCADEQSLPPARSVQRSLSPVPVCCPEATNGSLASTRSNVRGRCAMHAAFGQWRCTAPARYADSSAFLGWVSW